MDQVSKLEIKSRLFAIIISAPKASLRQSYLLERQRQALKKKRMVKTMSSKLSRDSVNQEVSQTLKYHLIDQITQQRYNRLNQSN